MTTRYPGGFITKNPVAPTASVASGMWTLEQQAQYIKAGTWPVPLVSDTYFEYNTLLLPGTGTNGAQNNTFTDSSSNNYTITRYGNSTQGTFSPFSQTGWSNYFDGTGDYFTVADNTALEFGSGDFTIEAWIYISTSGTEVNICQKGRTADSNGEYSFRQDGSALWFYYSSNGTTWTTVTSSSSLVLNSWNHVAIVRSGNTYYFWINGVQSGTGTLNITFYSGNGILGIGANNAGADPFTGYISNLRIVKGTAVYTSAFTPPTSPLTAISGTSLLTCQSNRFIDNSSNAFAITVNGDPKVQAFSPFNPTAAWSAATNGGSGYFDGTGDYLYTSGANLVVGTGTFTLEWWVYLPTSPSGWTGTVNIGDGTWLTSGRITPLISSGASYLRTSLGTSYTDFYFNNAPLLPGQWNHMAIQRETTGTVLAYCNGKVATSGSLSGSGVNFTIDEVTVANSDQGNLTGFISNVRLTKGSAVYSSTYTVPTSPVTGGSLLLNFTNAGIYDATSNNDLETVGNAQISSTTAKWGSTSIYFDGTGDYVLFTSKGANFNFSGGDFTFEFWIKSSQTGRCDPLGQNTLYSATGWWGFIFNLSSSGDMAWYENTNSRISASSTGWNNNSWNHVATTRSGNSVKMFLNGTQVGSTYTTSFSYGNADVGLIIGILAHDKSSGPLTGYIQDLRITKGYARYTSNFTAPTAAFPLF